MNADPEVLDETEYVAEATAIDHASSLTSSSSSRRGVESVPLLQRTRDRHVNSPWTRRPSLLWLLPPFFFTATVSGASITPRLSLISNLLCRSYYATKGTHGPALDEVVNCNIAAISGQIARLSTVLNTVTGLLAAFTAARYGIWSDRHGRRYPLLITMVGSFINDLCYVLVAKYYEHLSIYFLLIGAICDGLTGSFMASMAASYAYATDVVPPQRRAVAFGYFQCCFYGGIAIGPTLGGYLVKRTHDVLTIFYLAMVVHASFAMYTFFILPESLSEKRMELARVKQETAEAEQLTRSTDSVVVGSSRRYLRLLNIVEPLTVFFPSDGHAIIKRNLKLLMIIDICLLLNMGAFTIIILYGKFVFNWGDLQQGYLLSLIGGMRVVVLLGVLPIVVRFVRGKIVQQIHDHDVEHPPEGADALDIGLIRFSMMLEVIGFGLMGMATTSGGFYAAGGISALAGIGMPTLASVLTKHVDSTKTGQLLGAVALMQSLNRLAAPLLFGLLYSFTVATHPATCFVLLASMMGLGLILSLGLRPSTAAHLTAHDSSSEE
ncbi:Putative uncharacterized protein [Taphrina deformans PYCC 5710]|uniref:Major facilitator superfamily (MFS) profile domain-containing protein n=1 Tax=Taphrina deformans (strain PYCC 5710 / ATCC 11124 / CBS 356.35 / IMI 108563 / JCM 9778 / NBRC 8474) TaxID=1097556 RepID=R4ZYJ0_TAPDE|nr:Putative uncharacterized protein [Taphrina deformans PYCC 5710]|eukprot:CCX35401.1 Putative uncharacterized protein [Taphrina deformans PYCC 5710]